MKMLATSVIFTAFRQVYWQEGGGGWGTLCSISLFKQNVRLKKKTHRVNTNASIWWEYPTVIYEIQFFSRIMAPEIIMKPGWGRFTNKISHKHRYTQKIK